MNRENSAGIVQLVIIAGRGHKDALLAALAQHGAHIVNTLYGKGSVKPGVLSSLGLVAEEQKAVITCLINSTKLDGALRMLHEDFEFNKPNTGIAFTVAVSEVSF